MDSPPKAKQQTSRETVRSITPSGAVRPDIAPRPEILAPAGNREMMHAAIESGADAVYFGVQAFNARLRADNFTVETLPETMSWLHSRGVRGYLTINTLIFDHELPEALDVLRAASDAGVDAVLVQDLGLAFAAQLVAPELPLHASTQMTLSCSESVAGTDALGIFLERIVVPRELSRRELRRFKAECTRELETFVHGALCVAYSGQCLTSEALGGRSANRGECAQACRLPYDLIVDGEQRDLGDVRYLLSPKDLAAHGDARELAELGIASLKIEGRLKTPEYVAATVQAYRAAIEGPISRAAERQLEATFSRGFTGGYLHDINHQEVVDGTSSGKRGILIGTVADVAPHAVTITAHEPLKPGDGVLFDGGSRYQGVGGTVFQLRRGGQVIAGFDPETDRGRGAASLTLTFLPGKVPTQKICEGDRVYKTADPAIERELRATFAGEEIRFHRPISAFLHAHVGSPLRLVYTDWEGVTGEAVDDVPLEAAAKRPPDREQLRAQLARLGQTPFELGEVTFDLVGDPMIPHSRLNGLRRTASNQLIQARKQLHQSRSTTPMTLDAVRAKADANPNRNATPSERPESAQLSVLCRSLPQIEAALAAGIKDIFTDFEDPRHNRDARQLIPSGHRFIPASLRIVKPGERPTVLKLLRCDPDALLVRNLASWEIASSELPELPLIGDHSLNVANSLTASLLHGRGLSRLTPSYDLNGEQLLSMLREVPSHWFEVTIHQHVPMFHMEHCVFCRFLSNGTDASNCGRPCESHQVELRDRMGYAHPLKADAGCRNTVYNAVAQSGVEYLPQLLALGVRNFRLDLVNESAEDAAKAIELYQSACTGAVPPTEVWRTLRATSRLGVTRGTLDHDSDHAHSSLYSIRPKKPAHSRPASA